MGDGVCHSLFPMSQSLSCPENCRWEEWSAELVEAYGAIRAAWLKTLLPVHLRPMYRVIFPSSERRHLEGCFALRCFQRFSLPDIATQHCTWRHNWNTRGQSIPVLSY